jgi:hypothetical protein
MGGITSEMIAIGAFRVLGSLPVLRWPFAGALLAMLVDLSDLLLMNLLDLGGLGDYQHFDKYLDQVYLLTFLIVALRWRGPARNVSVVLYAYRLVGFVAFELTGERMLLLVFPNLFEPWFVVVAGMRTWRPSFAWSPARVVTVGGVLLLVKEVQEWALHAARLFDSITALDAIRMGWSWLTGLGG